MNLKYINADELNSPEFGKYINDETKDMVNEFKKCGGVDLEILELLPKLPCRELELDKRLISLIKGNAGIGWYKLVNEIPYIVKTKEIADILEYVTEISDCFLKGMNIESVKKLIKIESEKMISEKNYKTLSQENEELKKKLENLQKKYTDDSEKYKQIINERNKRIKECNAKLSESALFEKDRSEGISNAVIESLVKYVIDCTKEVLDTKRMIEEIYKDFENSTLEKFINARFTKLEEKVDSKATLLSSISNTLNADHSENPNEEDFFKDENLDKLDNEITDENADKEINAENTVHEEKIENENTKENFTTNEGNSSGSDNGVSELTKATPEEKRNCIITFFEELKKNYMLKNFKKMNADNQKKTINEFCIKRKLSIPMLTSVNMALKREVSAEFIYGLLISADLSLEEFDAIVKEA